MVKEIDPKSWVRQWVAIMMGLAICFSMVMYFICHMYEIPIEMTIFFQIIAIPSAYVGWFFRSRDVEKRQNYLVRKEE